jgi:hypothetical protein
MRRLVTVALLAVWLVFISIEFLEHAGLFLYPDQDVDRAVDAALVSLGTAFKITENEQTRALSPVPLPVGTFVSLLERVPAYWPSFSRLKADFFKTAVPVYMLHRHFRI